MPQPYKPKNRNGKNDQQKQGSKKGIKQIGAGDINLNPFLSYGGRRHIKHSTYIYTKILAAQVGAFEYEPLEVNGQYIDMQHIEKQLFQFGLIGIGYLASGDIIYGRVHTTDLFRDINGQPRTFQIWPLYWNNGTTPFPKIFKINVDGVLVKNNPTKTPTILFDDPLLTQLDDIVAGMGADRDARIFKPIFRSINEAGKPDGQQVTEETIASVEQQYKNSNYGVYLPEKLEIVRDNQSYKPISNEAWLDYEKQLNLIYIVTGTKATLSDKKERMGTDEVQIQVDDVSNLINSMRLERVRKFEIFEKISGIKIKLIEKDEQLDDTDNREEEQDEN